MRALAPVMMSALLLACPPSARAMEDYPAVQLRMLDKSTARTTTSDVPVGSTFQFGSLYIKVQACRQAEPLEKPESAAFLQVWELPPEEADSRWVFSGWMFASSPALSAMDHPVYDVWVLNCTGKAEPDAEAAAEPDSTPQNTEAPTESGEESVSD